MSNLQLFKDFKNWCYNTANKQSDPSALSEFVEKYENGDIIKCDCCGEMCDEEHAVYARYDEVLICPDCRADGN